MSISQVDSAGNLHKIAGLVNSEKINEMYEAFPSDSASASNKLVTASDALIYYQSDSSSITDFNNAVPQTSKGAIQMFYLGSDITNAPTSSGGGFIVVAEQLSTTYISQLATQIGTNNKYTRSKSTSGWSSWQKLVTEDDLTIKKKDISATGGATSFSTTIPLSMAQRNKPFYLEVLSVGNSNAIKEMKYRVFVSSINTNVTTQEISKDSNFTDVSITFDASTGYALSFSSTETLYSTTVYIQQ